MSKEQELDKVHLELAEVRRVLAERKEAAHFEPVGLDGSGERALRALSVVLHHGRDAVVEDLTEELVGAHQDTEMGELGENAIGPILLLVNPGLGNYPNLVLSLEHNTMTVRRFVQEVQDRLSGISSLVRMGVP